MGQAHGIPTRYWTHVSNTEASDQTTRRKGDDDTETNHDLFQVILKKKEEEIKKGNVGTIAHKYCLNSFTDNQLVS